MGKLTSQPQPAASIHHFSHPHPLQLSNYLPQQTPSHPPSCSGCKFKLSPAFIYTCTICNYFLHIPCSNLPQHITHPFHQTHTLTLLPNPIHPHCFFNCDACGKQGTGFSYHCPICNIHLHTHCSTMPLQLTHHSHLHHLNLTFSPPYPNKAFSCDICNNMGSKEWLYRCNLCEFDAHLACATIKPTPPPIQQYSQVQHNCQATTLTPQTYGQVPGFQYAQSPTLQTGAPTNYYTSNAYAAPGGVRTQQKTVSDRLVMQFLLNATIPGLGLLMQGQSRSGGGGGLIEFGGDQSGGFGDGGLISGDLSGMDFGGF
ncbi:hypothetical protein Pint_24111 [Pistacia integerrima]|uniref:Uncharacterized protein n=1 Tax=Pistacia integerrima TaxID=434235 RepID=A0ACC0YH13_9ROSI|nr:hypothetical protein Pint_24111 [Pistacia integerrima]